MCFLLFYFHPFNKADVWAPELHKNAFSLDNDKENSSKTRNNSPYTLPEKQKEKFLQNHLQTIKVEELHSSYMG